MDARFHERNTVLMLSYGQLQSAVTVAKKQFGLLRQKVPQ